MENWKNIDMMMSIERKDFAKRKEMTQRMIDCALNGEKEEVAKLLKEGASPNCCEDDVTPLIACVDADCFDLAKYLISAGASISYRPKENDALWHALRRRANSFVKMFVEAGCLLSREPTTNETALIFATKSSNKQAVEALLGHGKMKVNERDGFGNTALHYNVAMNPMTQDDIDIGKLLLAAGADSSVVNLDGKTPDDMASDYTAKTMLMAGRLEEKLAEKDDVGLSDEMTEAPSEPRRKIKI